MQIEEQTGDPTKPPFPGPAGLATAFIKRIPLPVLLCTAVFAVFFPVLGNDFVNWDDAQYVLSNPALRGSWLDALVFSPGYYHPLTTLTYKLEFVLFGLNPAPYHFTSLALHLAACVSAFYLLTALGARRNAAFLGALLFGIHPVHVEPVAWVSGRKELLWGIFSAWTLISYLGFVDTKLKRYFFYSLAFFLLAVLSKPFAIVLPFVLLLADYYRGRAFTFRLLLEKSPYLAIAAPLLTLSTAPSGFLLANGERTISFLNAVAFIGQNAVFYAGKFLLPVGLSALYPSLVLSMNPVIHFLLLLSGILAAFLLAKAQRPGAAGPGAVKKIFFGLGFFLITVFPALIVSPPADRYFYLPALGFCFLYAVFVSRLHGALSGDRPAGPASFYGRLLILAVTVHFLVLGLASARRVPVWRNSLTMWNDVLRKYPREHVAYYGRGNTYAAAGDYDAAIRDLTRCLELDPRYWKAFNNRGRIFTEKKEFDKAITDYTAAISVNPGEAALLLNRGNVYFTKGDMARAIADYDQALAIAPGFIPALENKKRASGTGR